MMHKDNIVFFKDKGEKVPVPKRFSESINKKF